MPTRILSRSDVERVATMVLAIEAVEGAFAAMGRGETTMPPKVYLDPPDAPGDFRAMPAAFGDRAGLKWVSVHPSNPSRGLPAVRGVYLLSDPTDGSPLAVLDASTLTALRTGAAAAVATKYLAASTRTLGVIGAGVQARAMIVAHRVLSPDLEVRIADSRPEVAARLAAELDARATTLEEACDSEVVCTCTPSHAPFITRAMLRGVAHVNAMGADAAGKRELATDVLLDAHVELDDRSQCVHSGEVNVPLASGEITLSHVDRELGEVVAGRRAFARGRGLTVFDSTGLAVQDLALARVLVDRAASFGVGTMFELER